jgi:hypothetical protein
LVYENIPSLILTDILTFDFALSSASAECLTVWRIKGKTRVESYISISMIVMSEIKILISCDVFLFNLTLHLFCYCEGSLETIETISEL